MLYMLNFYVFCMLFDMIYDSVTVILVYLTFVSTALCTKLGMYFRYFLLLLTRWPRLAESVM